MNLAIKIESKLQETDFKTIEFSKTTIIVHFIESIGLDQLIEKHGEVDTATVDEHLNM